MHGEGRLDPQYARAVTTFDDGLLGRWTMAKEGDEEGRPLVVEFTRRNVPVEAGVLHPERDVPKGSGAVAGAYSIAISDGDAGEQMLLNGYLVESHGRRFLGVQATPSQLAKGAGHPLSIPTHILCKIERNGERAQVWIPGAWVAWAPDLVMLDAPEGAPPPIDLDSLGGKVGLTTSIERLVEFCGAHADDPRLYHDAAELKRAAGPGPGPETPE